MISTLLSTLLIGQSQGVSNVHTKGPTEDISRVRATASRLGTFIFSPDNTALGYRLRSIEHVHIQASSELKGLPSRYAVRMTWENPRTITTFDFYQVMGTTTIPVEQQIRWILRKKYFDAVVSSQDTFATIRRGDRDVAFVGGLVSEESAQEILVRLIKVYPGS